MQEGFAYLQANGFGWVRAPVLVFFALYFGFISIITIQRSIIWGKPIELLEETLRYEPDALIAYNSLGKYYLDAREYQKAEQNFLEAIRRGTTSALPYFNLGLVYEIGSQPDFAKAEFFYREALARDPNYERALRRLHDLGTAPQP
jgi:tetratricopeptide (TPR) repeat protein